MTLEQLRVFVVVAEHEHVTHASYALDMVQSAVSKTIATLEGELTIRLFDRVGRNIKLTPRGAAFRDKAIELLDHAELLRAWTIEVRDISAGVNRPPWRNSSGRVAPVLAGGRPYAQRRA